MSDNLSVEQLANELSGATESEQPVEEQDSIDGETAQEATDEPTEAEGEQPEAEEQPEQPEEDSAPAPIELDINGEKVQLTLDEVKNGYLRQQDYTQKAQNLARERQEAQAQLQQEYAQVQALAGEYGQLTNIDSQLQQYQAVDWRQLRESDPLAYSTHMADMQNLRAMRADLQQQITGKQQHMKQQEAADFAQRTEKAREFLQKNLPKFGQQDIDSIRKAAETVGFERAELSKFADGRAMLALWKAAQWDALQAKKPIVQNKVAALPTKATKAAASAAPASQTANIEKRLSKSGKLSDFAALLSSVR